MSSVTKSPSVASTSMMSLPSSAEQTKMVGKFNPLDPIGSIFDNALKDVQKSVEEIERKAEEAMRNVIREAGDQAYRVIAGLKSAYTDSLEMTYKKADELMRENIDRAMDLANIIMSGTTEELLKVADKVQDIIKFSPLSNWWIPLLNETRPRFFAVDADPSDPSKEHVTQVMVSFLGNFAYADRSGCTPTLKVGDVTYQPASNNTKMLQFAVKVSSKDAAIQLQQRAYIQGALTVIWKSGYFTWTTSQYKVLLGMLPATPGKIQVVYTKAATEIEKPVISSVHDISRTKDHWTKGSFSQSADPSWHLHQGTQKLDWLEKSGQCVGDAVVHAGEPDTVYCDYSRKDGHGRVRIVFNEYQEVPEKIRIDTIDKLRWGSSIIAAPQAGEKLTKIVFEAFNGSHYEFQPRTDMTNPFVELREFDNTIQIKAKDAAKINDPAFVMPKIVKQTQSEGEVKASQESKEESKGDFKSAS